MLRTKASLRELVRFTPCQFSSPVLNMDIIPDPERQITLAANSEIFHCGFKRAPHGNAVPGHVLRAEVEPRPRFCSNTQPALIPLIQFLWIRRFEENAADTGYFSRGKLLLEVNLSARSSNFIMTADGFLFHTHQVGNSELAS